MRVREAKPTDSEAVRSVHSDSIKGLGTEAYSEEQVAAWARGCESANYAAAIEADELAYVVAEVEDDVVGFGSLKLAPPEGDEADVDAEVTGVYVHPSVAREGVGTRIYEELEGPARAREVRTLGLPRPAMRARSTRHTGTSELGKTHTSSRATNRRT